MSQIPTARKFMIILNEDQVARLDAFRWEHRQSSLTKAIETLINTGLKPTALLQASKAA